MARRAQQSSVVRCPYCEASLPNVAAECPECRFPLTMAAADCGLRAPDDARPIAEAMRGRPAATSGPSRAAAAKRSRFHGSIGHRMRITAWLLGVTAILLLLASVGALLTASSPGAASDREATANLVTALQRAKGDVGYRGEVTVATLGGGVRSGTPFEVSVERTGDLWFAAAKSASGRCYLLAARVSGGGPLGGNLSKQEPCTGAQVRTRLEKKLTEPRRGSG